jgi:hypothetical protein
MKLTKLSAAWLPEWTCRLMPALSRSDAGTASQLIPGVLLLSGWTTKGKPSRVWKRRDGSGIPRTGCAAPTVWTAVTGSGRVLRPGEQMHLVGLVPRPTSMSSGPLALPWRRAGNRWPLAVLGGVAALPAWQAQ